MRKYLYIWNNIKEKYIVSSGIEFKDFFDVFTHKGGIVLLKHNYDDSDYNTKNRFDFITNDNIPELIHDNIYGYGDFVFIDYKGELPELSKKTISEMLFFAHMGIPYEKIFLPELKNMFLYSSHDDGWFLKLYYSDLNKIEETLQRITKQPKNILDKIFKTEKAFWIENGKAEEEIVTFDIDFIINKRMPPMKKK